MQTIQVEIKSVFGREIIYPACEKAEGFCHLIGQKSLIGDRWAIDRAIYEEFLEMLPPLG